MEKNKEYIPFDLWDVGLAFWWGASPTTAGALLLLGQYIIRHNTEVQQAIAGSVQRALPAAARVLPTAASLLGAASGSLVADGAVGSGKPASPEPAATVDGFVNALTSGKPHLLLVGHTGGGKTTVLHALARAVAAQGARAVVCDVDAIAGRYPGYRVVGAGDDYGSINAALQIVKREVTKRRGLRRAGTRSFPPMWVFVDEVHDVVAEVGGAWDVLEAVIRRGRKLNIRVVIGTQDSQVKTLGLEGKSQLLSNMTRVDLRAELGQRVARVDGAVLKVPDLPSVDDAVERHIATAPTARTAPTAHKDQSLLAQLLGAGLTQSTAQSTPDHTVDQSTDRSVYQADQATIDRGIRERLDSGLSKNKIHEWLREEHGIAGKARAYEMINSAIVSVDANDDDDPPAAFKTLLG